MQKKTVRTRCPVCGSKETVKVGENTRRLRLPPIGSHPAFALAHLVVRRCKDCGAERQEKLEDALPHKSHTKRFSRLVIELAQWMTLSDIAAHLHVGWNLVQRIVKEELKRKVKRRRYRRIRIIAVDEIAVRKRHSYMTVVIDLESGQVVHAAEGRDMAAMIQKRRENILNYYDYPITNAALEGLNNKIKVLKRKAYGYRDMEFFKLRILTIHETKFSLAGS